MNLNGVPKKYHDSIRDFYRDEDGIWLCLKTDGSYILTGYNSEYTIHEDTRAECIAILKECAAPISAAPIRAPEAAPITHEKETEVNTMLQTATTTNAPAMFGPDLFARWVNYLDVSPRSVETYRKAIKQFAQWLQAHNITAPDRETVKAFRDDLREQGKSPATCNLYLNACKLFFGWMEQEGIYPNVAAHIKALKISTDHKKDALTDKQAARVLASLDRSTVKGARDFAMAWLMLSTGLREISISLANVEDLRTNGGKRVLYYKGKGHSGKDTFVIVPPEVDAAITDYMALRGPVEGSAPLFAGTSNNGAGGHMTTRAISAAIKNALTASGLYSDRLTGHSLRHTAATNALLGGSTIQEVQAMLDHSNVNTTLIYAHNLDRLNNTAETNANRAIVEALNELA